MTINDVQSHPNVGADVFYRKLRATTIAEAWKEPLKIGDLAEMQTCMQSLRSGRIVTFGEALCFICVESLVGLYQRRNAPTQNDKEYIAKQMVAKYKHWSVLDLPTFVNMCVGSRLPTQRYNDVEYNLMVLDIPSILDKLESYNRMRPNREALQGTSPARPEDRPLNARQSSHLVDGTEHIFRSAEEAKKYWRSPPNMEDARDRDFVEGVVARVKSAEISKRAY